MSAAPGRIRQIAYFLLSLPYLVMIGSVLFLLIIGAAGMLIYQDAWVMREQINNDFNQQQLLRAREVASQIDSFLSDIRVEIEELKRFLAVVPRDASKEAIRAALRRTQSKGVVEMGLSDAQGRIIEAQNAEGIKPTPAERILAETPKGDEGENVLGPLQSERTPAGTTIVTSILCGRVSSRDRPPQMLFAKVNVSELVKTVAKDIRSGETGYAWVINEKERFLYHPREEFVGKNAFTARKERRAQEENQPYISFKRINQIMKEEMLRGEEDTGTYVSGWHRGKRGEIAKLIAFTPVRSEVLPSGSIWSVAVVAPTAEVADEVAQMYVRHYTAGGAIVLGLVIFGLLLAIYQHRISQALKLRVEQTEASLQETERIYWRVVEQATDLIYIFDLDMRVVLLNPQTVEVFRHLVITQKDGGVLPDNTDLTAEEVWIGHRLDELMRPRDAAFMKRQIDRVLAYQASISYDHTIPVGERKVRLSTKLVPVRDDQREVQYLLGISRDVTEQAEMDQRIYNTEKLASIGTLAAGVAHEINNPLAVILGFTDLLLERFEPDSGEYEDLKVIETNANNAKKIVENMLTFARVSEGMEDSLDVSQSVETVLKIVKNTLMTKKIEVVVDLPDNLPRVRGDSREYQQVIFNLINNSVAAMEKAGGTITLMAREQEGWVLLTVEDTGPGIPDRIKAQVFDPFFTTKKVGEGTGLGLSLCYGIVKKYGGKMGFASVSAEDNPKGPTGTTFMVSMPVDVRDAAQEGVA